MSARPMATIWRSPPDIVRLAAALLEAREQAEHALHALLDRALAACDRAQLQVLLNGEAGEDVVELRHV